MIAVRTPLQRSDIRDPAAVRSGLERRIPLSAGKNNSGLGATASARVKILEQLAKDTRATPDQYDRNWRLALGTLGGGNHFIELAVDGDGAVWLTLHSGSRGVGNKIGHHDIKVAQDLCLQWSQQFALHNRNEMMDRVLAEVSRAVHGAARHEAQLELQRINSHHNFTQQETHLGRTVWVTRKGAIRARTTDWAMIPGSMGTRS